MSLKKDVLVEIPNHVYSQKQNDKVYIYLYTDNYKYETEKNINQFV